MNLDYDYRKLDKELLKMLDNLSIEQKETQIGPKLSEILRPIYAATEAALHSRVRKFTGTLHGSLRRTKYNWSKTEKGIIQSSFYIKSIPQPIKRGKYYWRTVDYGRFVDSGTSSHSNIKGHSSEKIARINKTIAKYEQQIAQYNRKALLATSQSAYRKAVSVVESKKKRIAKLEAKLTKVNKPHNVRGIAPRRFLTAAWDNNENRMYEELNRALFKILQELK